MAEFAVQMGHIRVKPTALVISLLVWGEKGKNIWVPYYDKRETPFSPFTPYSPIKPSFININMFLNYLLHL